MVVLFVTPHFAREHGEIVTLKASGYGSSGSMELSPENIGGRGRTQDPNRDDIKVHVLDTTFDTFTYSILRVREEIGFRWILEKSVGSRDKFAHSSMGDG